jgi:hypothetical protein
VQQLVDAVERRDQAQRERDRAGLGEIAAVHPPLQVDHRGLLRVELGNGHAVLEPRGSAGPGDLPHQLGTGRNGPVQLHP